MDGITGDLAGDSLEMATVLMVWIPGMASSVVDNISFTVQVFAADLHTETGVEVRIPESSD